MYFKIPTYRNKTAGGVLQESNTVRCIRTLEERTASGQRKQVTVLTLNRWDQELPAQAQALFTPEEIEQWAQWKIQHDEEHQRRQAERALSDIAHTLILATQAVRNGEAPPEPLWPALNAFTAALRDAGHTQPPRPRGRPKKG